ncbi:hypothetical protein [Streptomyces qinglanensis]|uniref:Secreted protein n=1 Tax=Streptomyces qinglanensis TaxID=943816 RepID=A0A1H9P1X4_9ACTN|nr:hypothetical protein [Streptomyces qinglanensis]SER42190.1 hypothetical protein SAMN05421870_101844 [Streptomyces qinglanensis]
MDVGVVIGLMFVLAVFIFGTIITLRVVRAVKRGVERTGAQVRRTTEETLLKARSAQPGPVGQAARIRLELRSSIDSTRAALEADAQRDPGLREAVDLLDSLHEHARHLDRELRALMEREPDHSRIAARLPEARERMRHIKESADSLRYAAQDRARRFDAEELGALRDRIDIESGALRHWTPSPSGPRSAADAAAEGSSAGEAAADRHAGPSAPDAHAEQQEAQEGRQKPAQSARPELGPPGQGSGLSAADLTGSGLTASEPTGRAAGRRDSTGVFEKRRPRNAS